MKMKLEIKSVSKVEVGRMIVVSPASQNMSQTLSQRGSPTQPAPLNGSMVQLHFQDPTMFDQIDALNPGDAVMIEISPVAAVYSGDSGQPGPQFAPNPPSVG